MILTFAVVYISYWWSLLHTLAAENSNHFKDVQKFLNEYNKKADELQRRDTEAWWNYEIDMTQENRKKTAELSEESSKFVAECRKKALELSKEEEKLPKLWTRQLQMIKGTSSPKNPEEAKEISNLVSKMTALYSDTTIEKNVKGEKIKLQLNKDLLPIMPLVRRKNFKILLWIWTEWRNKVGPMIKPLYKRFVELSNKGAKDNGKNDYGEHWRAGYEVESDIKEVIEKLWKEVKPLYQKLHAYVRYRLIKTFGEDVCSENGPLPAHLLNMWAQHWSHLYRYVVPYEDKKIPDVTQAMKDKGFDQKQMLKLAESFFASIGLDKMPDSFWEKSVFTRDRSKKQVCHPSSWDIGQGDVRLKMPCMGVNQGDLISLHHEMGHLEYYLMYKDKPAEFRTGANPGFHEAVGDTIALSVMTPGHLKDIGLIEKLHEDQEEDINFLMKQALQKIPFLPFAYIVDLWRWSVFAGDTNPDNYNQKWWKLRNEYQGIEPPSKRTEDQFDPGCFFHIAHNTEYLRYFISHILQFHFHEALCKEAGIKGLLHRCSIYNSKKAGAKFRSMLEMGKTKPWPDALEALTGSREMTSEPILKYFEPLERYLDKHRKENGYSLGWQDKEEMETLS